MLLAEQELGALALKATQEVVGAELEHVGGIVLLDFTFERPDLVRVCGGQRHDGMLVWACGMCCSLKQGTECRFRRPTGSLPLACLPVPVALALACLSGWSVGWLTGWIGAVSPGVGPATDLELAR